MPVNVQQMIDRYKRGISQGGTNYREGVTGKGTTWKTNAASDQAEANYAAGVQKAARDKLRQKGVNAVQGAEWENAASTIGAQNYTASAGKAGDKFSAVAQHVAGAADAAEAAAAQLPGTTIQERMQRSQAAQIAAHRYWANQNGVAPEV